MEDSYGDPRLGLRGGDAMKNDERDELEAVQRPGEDDEPEAERDADDEPDFELHKYC